MKQKGKKKFSDYRQISRKKQIPMQKKDLADIAFRCTTSQIKITVLEFSNCRAIGCQKMYTNVNTNVNTKCR